MKMTTNEILISIIALCLLVAICIGILFAMIAFKVFKSKRDILIDAFSKEYLIPRAMNMRNFAVMYLLEHGKLNLQRMDPFYEFYTYSQNKNFASQCKTIFQTLDPETIDLMYKEFLDHLSQILTYRCYYHANPEAKKLAEKENLALHEMHFNQESDIQTIKNMLAIEYSDSELFQLALDAKLPKASKKTIGDLIDYL